MAIFFVGYLISEVPSNILLARSRPSYYISAIMVAWGALVTGFSQMKSFRSLLVARFFLGIIEAGFMPGVLYFMSCWYKKSELGTLPILS